MGLYHEWGALSRFSRTLPHIVLATNDFSAGSYMRPLPKAAAMREIVADPPGWCTAVRIDVDSAYASTAWLDAEVPQPSLIVINPANGHGHYIWLLGHWVRAGNARAMRFLRDIRAALARVIDGADPAYAGHTTHNPLCGEFRVIEGPEAYSLTELAQYADLRADRFTAIRILGHRESRNGALFDAARRFAYGLVVAHRREKDYDGFAARVVAFVESANAALENPLPASEVRSISRSVTKWTWAFYRKTSFVRRRRYVKDRTAYLQPTVERRARALQLAARGLSTCAIARALNVSSRTVRRYLESGDTAREVAA